ncbi:MAG: replication initiator protein A [Firmicutes bacterium]|nr:replication initiator protein A [Bacillota bacterium]
MAGPIQLDYYYGMEAEQYTFYRIPKILLTDPTYKTLTASAKLLYTLMLDRMSLSTRNGWLDEEGRVYIYYRMSEIMSTLCCGHNKAIALYAELEKVGLIERKKQGQGRPAKIYVKNFVPKSGEELSQRQKPSEPFNGNDDFPEQDPKNKNYVNQTYLSHTDPSIYPASPESTEAESQIDTIDQMDGYRELLEDNIDLAYLRNNSHANDEMLNEIVDLLIDTVTSRKPTIRIAGQELPTEVVRSRFLKLNAGHIEYVIDSIFQNTTKVRNIRAYLLTVLYNAPTTISSYYTALVSHDLSGIQ